MQTTDIIDVIPTPVWIKPADLDEPPPGATFRFDFITGLIAGIVLMSGIVLIAATLAPAWAG